MNRFRQILDAQKALFATGATILSNVLSTLSTGQVTITFDPTTDTCPVAPAAVVAAFTG